MKADVSRHERPLFLSMHAIIGRHVSVGDTKHLIYMTYDHTSTGTRNTNFRVSNGRSECLQSRDSSSKTNVTRAITDHSEHLYNDPVPFVAGPAQVLVRYLWRSL